MEKITMDFYELMVGTTPSEEDVKNLNGCVLYLKDNNFSDREIFNILNDSKNINIKASELPSKYWEGSLLKPNTFYYHDKLRIMSKAPKWDPETLREITYPYFLEMKIMFTMDDLIEYFYQKTLIPVELRNRKNEEASFKYLLDKYKVMKTEPIDFILFLIDSVKEEDSIYKVFDLQKYEPDVFKMFEKLNSDKTIKKEIVWR